MATRLIWDQDHVSSSPVTDTVSSDDTSQSCFCEYNNLQMITRKEIPLMLRLACIQFTNMTKMNFWMKNQKLVVVLGNCGEVRRLT